MIIKVSSEEEFVYRYLQLLQGKYNLTTRELAVLHQIVLTYRRLEQSYKSLKYAKSKEANHPDKLWKTPKVLQQICEVLDMEFLSFRRYIAVLKDKGVFVDGKINKQFLPSQSTAKVEVVWT